MKISITDTRISSSDFGQYHYALLLYWSFGDRKSKAMLLRDIAVSRCDANKSLIDDKLAEYAGLYGLTIDELKAKIMEADRDKVSIAKLHELLEGGDGQA